MASKSVIQGEDMGVEVVLVAVAHKDQQGLLRPQWRQLPLPPVKEQGDGGQLHQEAAVGEIGNTHGILLLRRGRVKS